MTALPGPDRLLALAERLVAIPSVSPDVRAETRCARALMEALPTGVERGAWATADGRPVIWALMQGRSPRTVILLGHYDTVGVSEFARLGSPLGEKIAFHPAALREWLLGGGPKEFDATTTADLDEERRRPGTWMFGRGALDMKSGLAAAVGGLAEQALSPDALPGHVLLIATPDEECGSAGMDVAARELVRMRDQRRLELLGAINLDFSSEPVAYAGAMGKAVVGLWVLGQPTHAASPFGGVDASQLAAEIASHATTAVGLADGTDQSPGTPAVLLRLRDLKPAYDVQTAPEAVVELNLLTCRRSVEETVEAVRRAAAEALTRVSERMTRTREALGICGGGAWPLSDPDARVITYAELVRRAGDALGAAEVGVEPGDGQGSAEPGHGLDRGDQTAEPGHGHGAATSAAADPARGLDAREATLDRLRRLGRRARLSGPAVVVYLLPPFYPHAGPGQSPFTIVVRDVLAREEIEVRPHYPYISDASYLAWRIGSAQEIARHMPAFGREYRPPVDAARALDLDVVNLGPWGRDAHGMLERVNASYAFERLPGLIARVVREALMPR